MKHDEFFRKHPVFTRDDLAEHLSSLGEFGERTQESFLAHHRESGRVVRVRGGLYGVIPAGADPAHYPIDPFLLAAKLTPDATLSHHAALEFHGRAYSVQDRFTYLAGHPIGPFQFRGCAFLGVRFPLALRRSGKESFGVATLERAGMSVRVTGLERTLVDVLNRPDLSGSWEEVWRSLESIEFFDLDRVVEYALLLENATTAAKVGFFLEQHRESLMVEDRHLETLRSRCPRQPLYLDRARRRTGRFVSTWNLIVPEEVFKRTWEEVS